MKKQLSPILDDVWFGNKSNEQILGVVETSHDEQKAIVRNILKCICKELGFTERS